MEDISYPQSAPPTQIDIQIGDKGGLQSGRIRGQALHQLHDSIKV
jgi:hypothetical protein